MSPKTEPMLTTLDGLAASNNGMRSRVSAIGAMTFVRKCYGHGVIIELLQGAALYDACIVDEYVKRFPPVGDDIDDPAAALGICYVRRNNQMLTSLVEQRACCLKCGLAPPT